jgi:hypothetical protein
MAAVAAYQQQHDGLQVTGAVDVATARSLGVYDDPAAADVPTTTSPAATAVTTTAVPAPSSASDATETRVADASRTVSSGDRGDGLPTSPLAAGAVLALLVGAVVARRRHVVAKRKARRWARIHPATSPRRSVADMRRTGELPAVGVAVPVAIYDQEFDEPVAP